MISKTKRRTAELLTRRRHRERIGLALAEGPKVIVEALGSPIKVVWAAIGEEYAGTPDGWRIASLCRERGVETLFAPDREVLAICATESPRPALAVVAPPPLKRRSLVPGRYLVADGVQMPGNLGTLVRGAWGFGLDGVAIGEGTVDPWNPKVVRGSAGGVFRVPLVRVPPAFPSEQEPVSGVPPEVVRGLFYADSAGAPLSQPNAWRDQSGDPTASGRDASDEPPNWVLVVGNETHGVSDRYRRACRAVGVPLAPGVDSLNVGVAGSILMHVLSQGLGSWPEPRASSQRNSR